MKHNKNLYILISIFLISSCGSGNDSKDVAQYYKKQQTQTQQLELSIEASGIIEAISSVEIKSKASGEILFLGAEVGDFVNKGSVLGQIDQRTPKNILDQSKSDLEAAKVRLSNAESQYERGKELHEKGSISDKDYEDIQENYAQAKSTLVRTEVTFENAKIALDDTVVRSPVTGTIISRTVEVGQVISSPTSAVGGGTLLMTMADLSKVRVRSLVDEIDVGKVTIGQTVSIKVAAYRDKEFFGIVSKVEPLARIEQNVTTFPVLIDINNDENLLLLGMNTDVVIEILKHGGNTNLIPLTSIYNQQMDVHEPYTPLLASVAATIDIISQFTSIEQHWKYSSSVSLIFVPSGNPIFFLSLVSSSESLMVFWRPKRGSSISDWYSNSLLGETEVEFTSYSL